MVNLRTMEIIATAFGNGSMHDFRLFKESYAGIAQDILCLADTGYLVHRKDRTCQNIEKCHTG